MTTIKISAFTDKISDRDFEKLCADNPEAKFETTKEGKLIVMSPTGSLTGKKNGELFGQIWSWNKQYKLGEIFDSSTGFKLSNGATRSPDVSWIEVSRWSSLDLQKQERFAPIDPDFVVELRSLTDEIEELQQKMTEYMDCDVKLGWLINCADKQVEIYRVGQDKEVLDNPQRLSGEKILPNLIVDLTEIF